jgi:hypothetical protein
MRDAAGVATGALLVEVLAGAIDWFWTGSVGMGAPLMGMVLGIVAGLSLHARSKPGWLTRASLRRIALGVGVVHLVLGGLLWGATTELGGASLLLGIGAIGLLVGFSALVVTMCVGDAVAMVFSPFADVPTAGSDQRPDGPWRRR